MAAEHGPGRAVMSTTVTLPSGAEVVIRDADAIRVRDRRALMADIEAAVTAIGSPPDRLFITASRLIAFAVEKWTLDSPLLTELSPAEGVELLDQWTPAEYDALDRAIKPISDALFPDYAPSPEPDSPTMP